MWTRWVATNYSGNRYTAPQLAAAVYAAPAPISGFWINDPANIPYCPQCTGPYPQVVIDLLHELSPQTR